MAQMIIDPVVPKRSARRNNNAIEKADSDGGQTGGETVLRISNVSEPTITVIQLRTKWPQVLQWLFVQAAAIIFWLMTWKVMKFVNG